MRRVVIAASGVVTPLGETAAEMHRRLCAGEVAFGAIEELSREGLSDQQAAQVRGFDPASTLGQANFRPLDRTARLAAVATHQALTDSGWSARRSESDELGLVLGTMFCSVRTIAEFDRRALTAGPQYAKPMDFANTVLNAAAGQTAIWHRLRGVNATISAGSASAVLAIAYAADLVRSGRCPTVLAGGVEELSHEALVGFERLGELMQGADSARPVPFADPPTGFLLGEGAGMFLLEDHEAVAARGDLGVAELIGQGQAFDRSQGTDEKQTVAAIGRCLRLALDGGADWASQPGVVYAAANGGAGDRPEAAAIADVLGSAWPVTTLAGRLGECLGASAALACADAVEAFRDGQVPGAGSSNGRSVGGLGLRLLVESDRVEPRRALIVARSREGHCAALQIARVES